MRSLRQSVLLAVLLLMIGSPLFAQQKYTFSQFGDETWSFVKQPVTWNAGDWLKLGLTGAGTILVMQADQPVRDAVLRDQRYSMSVPMEFGRMWGELYTPVILFGGYAIHSLIANDMGTRKIAYEIGQASLYAGATTYLLKMIMGRSRPYVEEGPRSFHPFSAVFIKTDYQSLPGGHNAAAFVVSTVLSRNAGPLWLKIVAYVPAALTLVSRVYQDKHWVSDDFLGALIGYFIATWVVDQHENGRSNVEVSSGIPFTIRITL